MPVGPYDQRLDWIFTPSGAKTAAGRAHNAHSVSRRRRRPVRPQSRMPRVAAAQGALSPPISSSSMARTPPAASASPRQICRGPPRRRRRRRDHRQPRLGPARGARLHRPPAAPPAPGQFPARHARPRRGHCSQAANGARVLVINVMGRVFMDALDDPFQALDRELGGGRLKAQADAIIIDFHAETTAREAGHRPLRRRPRDRWCVGTHTHVPTADHQILPGGTAYMTDVGMCGDYKSVIGMHKEEPLAALPDARSPSDRFEPAMGPATICGVAIETDPSDRPRTPHRAIAHRRHARPVDCPSC